MLMEEVKDLSLIIDLTNTQRYYTPEVFTARRIEYEKIYCEGHKVPNANVVSRFFQRVENHLRSKSDEEGLIGVHCTHGVNRTGYLVCKYMIDKLGFSPADAIKEFNSARGANMERENYLDSLRGIPVPLGGPCVDNFDERGHDARRPLHGRRFNQRDQDWNARPRGGQTSGQPQHWSREPRVRNEQPSANDHRPPWRVRGQQPNHQRPTWSGSYHTDFVASPRGGQGSSWEHREHHRADYGPVREAWPRPSPYDRRSPRGQVGRHSKWSSIDEQDS